MAKDQDQDLMELLQWEFDVAEKMAKGIIHPLRALQRIFPHIDGERIVKVTKDFAPLLIRDVFANQELKDGQFRVVDAGMILDYLLIHDELFDQGFSMANYATEILMACEAEEVLSIRANSGICNDFQCDCQ